MADDFQRRSSSSRQSSAREDKPASRSSTHHEEGSANGKEGGGGGGGGGGGAAKKKFGVAQILAIVALIITLVAVGLSIWCSLLWWDWPFVITIPALSLALAAVVLAFVAPSHFDAILCCSVIGLIFGLAGLIWCAVEIGFCHSYQGPLANVEGMNVYIDKYDKFKEKLDKLKEDYIKAKYFHDNYGFKCNGECYDWWYRKEELILKAECQQASEKWFLDKQFKSVKDKICGFNQAYDHVDSYKDSPIYKTHEKIAENNVQYPSSGDYSKSSLKAELKKICAKFNVDKFVKQREKCDKKLKKKFDPGCWKEKNKFVFQKGKGCEDDPNSLPGGCKVLDDIDDCNKEKRPLVYQQSKFVRAMGNSPDFKEVPSPSGNGFTITSFDYSKFQCKTVGGKNIKGGK